MSTFDGIHKPLQKRSELTARRILEAVDALLREKPYDQITIQEVSQRSGAGISSIYARFSGKEALLIALHETLTASSVAVVDSLIRAFAASLRDQQDPVVALSMLYERYIAFARSNRHLYRAIMMTDQGHAYERIAAQTRHASALCHELLRDVPGIKGEGLDLRVDVMMRMLSASFQQIWFLGDVYPTARPMSDTAFAHELAIMTLPYLLQGQ